MNENAIISNLSKINRLINHYIIEELEKRGIFGIVASHGSILSMLFVREHMTFTDLSLAINREKNTITMLIRKLEELGYVYLKKDPNDGRKKVISLTVKGLALKPDFMEISRLALEKVYEDFEQEEKLLLLEYLDKILINVSESQEV
ncbi:MAG: MarR family transcriptional regulator [Vallitaleaceae bacterium]|jgi:DNA-binding MarR family transcriptional regulator|nr:MarR family transcriptional regulator [Vallitaleaceae bacterium]